MKISKKDIFILAVLPLAVLAVSLLVRSPYHILSSLLFYGLPAAYLIIRFRGYASIFRHLIFIVIVSTPFAIVVDYIGIKSGLWLDPQVIFTNKLFGIIPFDDFIWMYSATFLITVLYATFFDFGNKKPIDRRMIYFAIPAAIILGIFFFLVLTHPAYFLWGGKYAYLKLGMAFFIPAVLFLIRFPEFFKKLSWITAYFFYVTLLLEQTASYLGQWVFKGTYLVMPFSLFGYGFVPLEELFFIGIIGPAALIAFYEIFDNGRLKIKSQIK